MWAALWRSTRISLDFSLSLTHAERIFLVWLVFPARLIFISQQQHCLSEIIIKMRSEKILLLLCVAAAQSKKKDPFLVFSFLALFSFPFSASWASERARRLYSPRSVMLIFCVRYCMPRATAVCRGRSFFSLRCFILACCVASFIIPRPNCVIKNSRALRRSLALCVEALSPAAHNAAFLLNSEAIHQMHQITTSYCVNLLEMTTKHFCKPH